MGAEEDPLNGMCVDSRKDTAEVINATWGSDLAPEEASHPFSSVGDTFNLETLQADGSLPCEQYETIHQDTQDEPSLVDVQAGIQREKRTAETRKSRPDIYMVDERSVETQQEDISEQDGDTGACEMTTEETMHAAQVVEETLGIAVLRKLESRLDKTGGAEVPDTKQDDSVEKAEAEVVLARALSSSNSGTCMKAMSDLERWLSSNRQVDEAQLAIIWKGIFYQVWRTCSSTSVAELFTSVGRVLEGLDPELALLVFKVLLSSLGEEWSRIDNKKSMRFRQLLHVCVRQIFKMLTLEDWKEELTSKFIGSVVAQTETLSHALLQPFFQELKLFVPSSTDTLKALLEPFIAVYADNHSNVLQKVRDFVFTPLLQEARAAAKSNVADAEEKTSLGAMVLRLSISVRFLEMSSWHGLSKINKKLVDQLHEDFKKSEKRRPSLQALKKLKQEIVAASTGEEASNDVDSAVEMQELSVSGTKRKRVNAGEASYALRSMKKREKQEAETASEDETRNELSDVSAPEEDEEQRPAKRVRFSLRDNVVWSPSKPLPPPAWVTLPPGAVPRGSALKAGVLPGPIAEPGAPKLIAKQTQNSGGTGKRKKKRMGKQKRKGKASKRQKTS